MMKKLIFTFVVVLLLAAGILVWKSDLSSPSHSISDTIRNESSEPLADECFMGGDIMTAEEKKEWELRCKKPEEKIEKDTPINFCTKNSDCVLGETGMIIKEVKCITLEEKESKNIADPNPENLMVGGYCGCQENKCNDIGGIPTTDCLNCS